MPEASRSPGWSRRTVLRAFAPVSLLAVSGCGDSGSDSAKASATSAAPSRTTSPAAASDARPIASAQPEVSQAPAVTDAVALTFHGDGSPELAQALLAEAEKVDARLTVLAVGQ